MGSGPAFSTVKFTSVVFTLSALLLADTCSRWLPFATDESVVFGVNVTVAPPSSVYHQEMMSESGDTTMRRMSWVV